MAHILVVEDDCAINELIARNLKLVGHSYSQAFDGEEAVRMASVKQTDLILLDVMLPGLDGFEVIKKIAPTPVIFITAKTGLEHRLRGLSLGADDYIAKPFEMLEMLARVEAVLRRTKKSASAFSLDNVTVDLLGRKVTAGGENIELSHQEYELLEVLIANRNIAMSREKLLELAWGYDYLGESRTVDTHIQKLRSKLGWENRIKTVYKLGYRLEV
ncbi:MAG: response regulator transcription factor [Clostridiales bacterium]|jgi:DNA-binding response OmpR family regulator|nr:response regulator transcription factor [Clostridiales bacterium]